jgi:hypothetical protein
VALLRSKFHYVGVGKFAVMPDRADTTDLSAVGPAFDGGLGHIQHLCDLFGRHILLHNYFILSWPSEAISFCD